MDFLPFPKLARLNREITITEKLDGTNAQVRIVEGPGIIEEAVAYSGEGDTRQHLLAGSWARYITPANDNYGFAAWVKRNAEELFALGPGQHFGEWWGQGIQRRYNLQEKRFSLFNTGRWLDQHTILHDAPPDVVLADITPGPACQLAPKCCSVVPVLYHGLFSEVAIQKALNRLSEQGSYAAPGFLRPEGIVVWHEAARQGFKVTLDNDGVPKSRMPQAA